MKNEPMLRGPIPGMSLTAEPRNRPWQQPPQYSTVDEAADYYIRQMSSEEFGEKLIDVLEMGIPVTELAETVQLKGVMDGKHSIDVGILLLPVLMEMLMMLGDMYEIDYTTGLDKREDPERSDSVLVQQVLRDLEKGVTEMQSDETEVVEEPAPVEKPRGIMQRRD